MSALVDNLPQGLLILGILALIIEVLVLGFATFVLFYLGLSLVLSGGLMLLGVLPDTLSAALWSNVLLTGLSAAILWKPMHRMQEDKQPQTLKTDFADRQFVLEDDVDSRGLSGHRYSGVDWKLKSQEPIPAGTLVQVERADVGVLWVTAID
jgi:membrane protein implicated in regulation of membrane protease activity